jgi:hypothetical protein
MKAMEARPLKRYRGYILGEAGRHKLQVQLSRLESQKGYKFTLQILVRQTQLVEPQRSHSTTIKKIVKHQIGVNEQSIKTFFQALELELEPQDYHSATQQESLIKLVGGRNEPKAIESQPVQSPDFPGGAILLHSPYPIKQPILPAQACADLSRPGDLIEVKAPRKMEKGSLFASIDRFLHWFSPTLLEWSSNITRSITRSIYARWHRC